MIGQLLALLRSKVAINSTLVFLGNIFTAGISFLALVLIARKVGPMQYGVFATASATLALIAEMGDLGINAGLVRFASEYINKNNVEGVKSVFSFAIRSRIRITLTGVCIGIILAHPLANSIFHNSELTPLFILCALGVIPMVCLSFFSAVFQSYQQFNRHILINLISGISILISTLIFIFFKQLSPSTALLSLIIGPLIGSALGFSLVDRTLFSLKITDRALIKDLGRFSIWMALWSFLASFHDRLDLYMLSSLRGAVDAGNYNAADQLSTAFILFIGAIGMVLNPYISHMKKPELKRFLKKSLPFYPAISLLVVIIIFTVSKLVTPIFGQSYSPAIPLFKLLMIALLFFSYTIIPNSILYALNKPSVFTIIALFQLIFSFFINLLFIPKYHLLGVGYSYIIVNAVSLSISLIAITYYFHKVKTSHE